MDFGGSAAVQLLARREFLDNDAIRSRRAGIDKATERSDGSGGIVDITTWSG
jgi:hypothetical protein